MKLFESGFPEYDICGGLSKTLPWNPEVFSLMNEREVKPEAKLNTREPLGAHVRSFERTDPLRSCY